MEFFSIVLCRGLGLKRNREISYKYSVLCPATNGRCLVADLLQQRRVRCVCSLV